MLKALLGAALVLAAGIFYLIWYFRWERRQTHGMAYYSRPLAERRALKQKIRWYSAPAVQVARLIAAATKNHLTMPSFEFEGVTGPRSASSPEVFASAKAYQPGAEDVFVATQMRCGTTWMQQIVHEIVMRGRGDLTDAGYRHIQAVSPWIDAVNSVSMADAPLVGRPPTRIIKTHLPTSLCPYSPAAKYIYVTRHPVSCFASIVDFNRSMIGPLVPPIAALADWFCSDRMYWLPWPKHVDGWWQWSRTRDNVLFVHFEEMKRDLSSAIAGVARFLGQTLTGEELARITERCTFEYMQEHDEEFEMAPPTMFSVAGGKFLVSGKASRHEDVTPAVRARILDYCRTALKDSTYPASRFYPDLACAPPADDKTASFAPTRADATRLRSA